MRRSSTVAALYVDARGVYSGLPGVEVWDEARDARLYAGPWPVVAHPPCERWGRFWHGSTRRPHVFKMGDDDGCFEAALEAVRRYGGVLEHPSGSRAWDWFGLNRPVRGGGWCRADFFGGYTCYVEQFNYGHSARKPTWLYLSGLEPPDIDFRVSGQVLPQWMVARYGYEKARRIGVIAMIGGKDKKAKRAATPVPFRDLLLDLASQASP